MGPHCLKVCGFQKEGVGGGWLGAAAPRAMTLSPAVVTPELSLLGTQPQAERCIERFGSNETNQALKAREGGEARENISIMTSTEAEGLKEE